MQHLNIFRDNLSLFFSPFFQPRPCSNNFTQPNTKLLSRSHTTRNMSSPYAEIPTHNVPETKPRFTVTRKHAIVSIVALLVLGAVGVGMYYKEPIISSTSIQDVLPSTQDLSDYFHRVMPAMPYTAPLPISHLTASNDCATKPLGVCIGAVDKPLTKAIRQCTKKFDFGATTGPAIADVCECKAVGPATLVSQRFIKAKGLCFCYFEKNGDGAYWEMKLDCKAK